MRTNQLFTTEEEINKAVADFKSGIGSNFWQVMCQVLDANIEIVKDKILHKPDGADEKEMDRLRGNLKIMEDIRNTPEDMIKKLTSEEVVDTEMIDVDNVYDSVEEKKP